MRLPGFFRNVMARLSRQEKYEHRRSSSVHRTVAGVAISPDEALTNSAFWAGHRYLTQTVAQLPKRVMRETSRDVSERVYGHPVSNLLTWRTNDEISPFQFVETLTGWAITHGNGVAEIEPDNAGRVAALWPIHPDRVSFCRSPDPLVDARGTPIKADELYYDISNGPGAQSTVLACRNVFHIRGFGNGPVGLSVVAYAAQSLGWAKATELFGATFFGEGLNPAGLIESPNNLSSNAKDDLLAELDKLHKGPLRGNRWAVIDGGMKWSKLSTQPNEAQFIETKQFQIEEMCRWLGVPPQKVHHLLRMTFNNVEQLSIEVVVDSVTPWTIRWEEESNYKLFGQNRAGFFVKFDLKGLLRGAFKDRQEGLQVMRRNGVINASEWRELEDIGPMGDESGGEIFIVEGNMTRLDQVGAQIGGDPAGTPQPAPPDVGENDPAAAAALLSASLTLGMREHACV